MNNLFAQSTFFHKPTMQVFFVDENDALRVAPVTESGTVLFESQEVIVDVDSFAQIEAYKVNQIFELLR